MVMGSVIGGRGSPYAEMYMHTKNRISQATQALAPKMAKLQATKTSATTICMQLPSQMPHNMATDIAQATGRKVKLNTQAGGVVARRQEGAAHLDAGFHPEDSPTIGIGGPQRDVGGQVVNHPSDDGGNQRPLRPRSQRDEQLR